MTDARTSKELLPCAHCGGAAQLTEVEPMHYVVECSEPICNMSTRVYISAMDDSRPLAIEAWNRRVAVETEATQVTTYEVGETSGVCKHCGLSWLLHIAEDDRGRKNVGEYSREDDPNFNEAMTGDLLAQAEYWDAVARQGGRSDE